MITSHQYQVTRWAAGRAATVETDLVAQEEPLEIRVKGQSIAITMRTPGHDEELALGFLVSEGLITKRADILEVAYCPNPSDPSSRDNILNVFSEPSLDFSVEKFSRHVFISSSCGICGKASIEMVHQHFPPVTSNVSMAAETLRGLPDALRSTQSTFEETGGLHAAAIFATDGTLVVAREDVGRHNAVDKVIGFAFLQSGLPLERHVLLVSGRASFEIVQKALAARIAIVAAISAPSSLAVELAQDSGQTLIGFLRGPSFNVYSHAERIEERPASSPVERATQYSP